MKHYHTTASKCRSFTYRVRAVNYTDNERATRVTISDPETGALFFGTARRHPDDEFDFAIGYNIALNRALSNLIAYRLKDEEGKWVRINDLPF